MSLDETVTRLETNITPAFHIPHPGVRLLGFFGGTHVGLELQNGAAGQQFWNLHNKEALGTFPVPIYPKVWNVEGRPLVMQYHLVTGGILHDLETAKVLFILGADGKALVPGSKGWNGPVYVDETINDIHQRGDQFLVENSSLKWPDQRVLYNLKTGKIVASRDNTYPVRIIQERIVGQDTQDNHHYDLETGEVVFTAPPDGYDITGSIVELEDMAVVNSGHTIYDLRSRKTIAPLPREVPDSFNVQLIEGKAVVPGFDRKMYYDLLTGKIAFTLPTLGRIQRVGGRYFLTPDQQKPDETVIYEIQFSPVTVH